jgi:hypothetical protein
MAEEQATVEEAQSQEEERTQNGSNGRRTALRAAALAAAGGATAIAARKALSGRHESQSGEGAGGRSGSGDESLFTSMLTSGWDSARESLLPLAEEAAEGAGEFIAKNAPDFVRESLVPKFISGFEGARTSSE